MNKLSGIKKPLVFAVILTVLFVCRVLAQLGEYFVDIPGIPEFEKWHSAAIPYPVLLLSQILIITLMVRVCMRLMTGTWEPSAKAGKVMLVLGLFYLGSMLVRHALGLTVLSHTVWFTSFLSIYFHYVLSLFLITCGYLHLRVAGSTQ